MIYDIRASETTSFWIQKKPSTKEDFNKAVQEVSKNVFISKRGCAK